jgi:hypothetical protein
MKISVARKRALCRELQKIEAILFDQEIPPRIAIMRTYAGSRFAADTKKKGGAAARRQIAFDGAE